MVHFYSCDFVKWMNGTVCSSSDLVEFLNGTFFIVLVY
jgi:hypothetical protein